MVPLKVGAVMLGLGYLCLAGHLPSANEGVCPFVARANDRNLTVAHGSHAGQFLIPCLPPLVASFEAVRAESF